MKSKKMVRLVIGIVVILAVAAALWYFWVRPAGSLASAWNTLLNPPAASSTALSASGTVETIDIAIAPEQAGKIVAVNVQEGDTVKAGEVLFQLDDTLLKDQVAIAQVNLDTAKQALLQLTSPTVLAAAQKAVAQDQIDLTNAQQVLNDQLYFTKNTGAIQNAASALVLAKDKLSTAQSDYANVSGNPDTSTVKARAYQQLYTTQLAYNNALFTYNIWSGENNQQQINLKSSNYAMIKAKLAEDQSLVATISNGQIPDNATGTIIAQIQQARFNIRLVQANLDLLDDQIKQMAVTAPVDGVVITRNAQPGSVVNAGDVLLSLGRLDQLTITVYVPEQRVGEVALGQSANVSVDAFPGIPFKAVVSYISDQAEFTPRNVQTVAGRQTTVFAVKLTLTDASGKLKPGMPADVTFNQK